MIFLYYFLIFDNKNILSKKDYLYFLDIYDFHNINNILILAEPGATSYRREGCKPSRTFKDPSLCAGPASFRAPHLNKIVMKPSSLACTSMPRPCMAILHLKGWCWLDAEARHAAGDGPTA